MGIATAALVSGDGDWENIQEVLRSAFLAHDEQLQAHTKRLDASEERTTELSAVCSSNTESLAKFQGLRGHVDALARAVNTLSEELKQRAQEEQEQRRQLKTWMESITRTVETQVNSAHERISDVESVCAKALDKTERRMELVEEELGHFVDALERKADLQVVQTHKKAVEEALKLRCRKAAFDKEVQRVHQLLRTQMSTTTERLELMRHELTEELQRYQQQQEGVAKETKAREVTTQQLREQLMSEIDSLRQETQAACADRIVAVKTEMELRLAEALGSHAHRLEEVEAVKLRVEELRQELETRRLEAEGGVVVKVQELRECVELRLVQLEQYQYNQAEDSGRMKDATSQLTEQLLLLQSKLEEVAQHQRQTTQELERQRSGAETRQTELTEELREGWRAREKKTRQQMHLVADKLREMDQILKLVGKQLVQNTSQLQLLWNEQRELDEGDGDVTTAPMIEDGEAVVAQLRPVEATEIDPLVEAEAADAVARRVSQHQQLQDSIEAKLRDYDEILLLHKHTPPPPPLPEAT